ncbi:MAG: 6-bladed beta-propeller [Candidatus Abyssobacteria bacterium SURF_5]|uniref:6-bladed beta-propeller n=1 Tax=Abyssobacteria bacterium (strain SURF_5) TaxID=2093360 RepID=A0A3A4NMF0_ABYX5|nr:MAG: 6-bladed beta-propeller [Candidatus Abyssubacteria bacterium SURF_5]
MDGWVTVNYVRSEDDGETFTSMEQRVRLNWNTAFSNVDLLNLYFQFARQEQTNPDSEELRPLVGLNLVGPEYRLMTEYRQFTDRNLEDDGFTLETDTFFTVLDLDYGPEFPDLTLDFIRVESKDDADEPRTDFVETDFGLRTTYQNGPLLVRYSHRENIFDNNLTFLSPIELDAPIGVAVDIAGTIYVTDAASDRVLRFSPSGAFIGEFGSFGTGQGLFRDPAGIAVSPDSIYVVDSGNDRVQRFDLTGTFVSEWGILGSQPGEFNDPFGIAVDPTGVYVTDRVNDRVQKFTADGIFLFSIIGFNEPHGIASSGSLIFVADTSNHRIQVFTVDGTFVTQWGSFGSGPGQFQFPADVAVDSSNRVYVTDRGNNRIQVFTTTGAFLDSFGTAGSGPAEFQAPEGIAITPADDLVVADTGNGRFQVLTNNGMFRFAIGSVSAEERGRSTELSLDTFNIAYSKELFTGVFASVDYDLFLSNEEDKDTGEDIVGSENHDIDFQLRLLPYRWMSFTSLYNFRFLTTESGDVETDRDEFTQSYILALQPIQRAIFSASFTKDEVETNIGPDEGSTFTTVSLNMFPTNRVNLNLSYSDLQSEEDGEQVLETDTFSAIADMNLYRGIDLNLAASTSKTQDLEADGEIDTQRVRGLLRLVPRPTMLINLTSEYTTSDSTFAGTPDISTETLLSSADITWALSRRLSLFLNLDYLESESADISTSEFNYLSDVIWRMNNYLTFFVGHRGGTEEEEVASFRTQARFPFMWDTRMTVNYEIEAGQKTDNQFFFFELSKLF